MRSWHSTLADIKKFHDAIQRALDSTAHAPRVTSPHVHERPEGHPSRGTAGDEAAGHGEHEGHHR
mgnify:CR=1 FL=1